MGNYFLKTLKQMGGSTTTTIEKEHTSTNQHNCQNNSQGYNNAHGSNNAHTGAVGAGGTVFLLNMSGMSLQELATHPCASTWLQDLQRQAPMDPIIVNNYRGGQMDNRSQ